MSPLRRKRWHLWLFLPLGIIAAVMLWSWRPWQRPIVIRERVNPRDGAVMVWVPAGTFRMGSSMREGFRDAARRSDWREMCDVLLRRETPDADETPAHTVYLDGYWIYKYEVTVAQYRQFCRATGRQMPLQWRKSDRFPIMEISWADAQAYARWANASLPTEAQWEKAARGPDGRKYPWGHEWDGTKCAWRVYDGGVSTVGKFPSGASPYGAQDMAGNAWEWCADWYAASYYAKSPPRNPTGPATGTTHVIRGGTYASTNDVPHMACRLEGTRNNRFFVGFRCVVVHQDHNFP